MPRRTDISSILVIGAGPIAIGQAAVDYSGTRAAKTLGALLLAASLTSCTESAPADPGAWLGEACGVPDLRFTQEGKQISLAEYQVQGTIRTEEGIGTAPVTDRQRLIERAMPCLEREAGRRGLTVYYPVVNVDA